MTIVYIFASVIVVSLVSLIGVIYLALQPQTLKRLLFWLISFAAGTMLGGAFLHLLPELTANGGLTMSISLSILAGILVFFALEKIIHWHHCHMPTEHEHPHPLAFTNVIGDGLHNFLDGVIIAGSYFISPAAGLATTLAVVLHEIPQEIGDFGVLIHAGLSRGRAIVFNAFSALTAVIGAAAAVWLHNITEQMTAYITAVAIGGFIYIAVGDLLPELKKDSKLLDSLRQLIGIILGVTMMAGLLLLE